MLDLQGDRHRVAGLSATGTMLDVRWARGAPAEEGLNMEYVAVALATILGLFLGALYGAGWAGRKVDRRLRQLIAAGLLTRTQALAITLVPTDAEWAARRDDGPDGDWDPRRSGPGF